MKESREENERLNEQISDATKPQTPSKEDAAVFSDLEDDVPETPASSSFFKEEEIKQLQTESEQKQRSLFVLIYCLEFQTEKVKFETNM